jgi:putative membrane protein
MLTLLIVKIIHYLCFSALLYSSAMKNWLLCPARISLAQLQRLRRFDKLSGAAAGVILLTGLAMLLWLAKPTGYYLSQPLFLLKISIFVIASSLIVLTKIAFKRALASAEALWTAPRKVKLILAIDLSGLVMMAVLGYLVAHSK